MVYIRLLPIKHSHHQVQGLKICFGLKTITWWFHQKPDPQIWNREQTFSCIEANLLIMVFISAVTGFISNYKKPIWIRFFLRVFSKYSIVRMLLWTYFFIHFVQCYTIFSQRYIYSYFLSTLLFGPI